MTRSQTRRSFFVLAGTAAAGAAGLGVGGCEDTATRRASSPPPVRSDVRPAKDGFVSRPDLTPPRITVRHHGDVGGPHYIFVNSPSSGPGHGGTMILDSRGELVWFGPDTASHHKLDLDVQMLDGQPALTWWQGQYVQGHGEGEAVIADASYRVRHVIRAHNGLMADLHEFNVTPQGTALITAYRRHASADLRERGGPANGYLFSGVAQEIDIATGELLFEWDSYRQERAPVPVGETYQRVGDGYGTATRPFDYFHINSVAPDADGDLLISSRHTWTIYKVSRKDGSIVWRMGGKRSDFSMGRGSRFAWQHHARAHSDSMVSVFDNGSPGKDKHSRALLLEVDTAAMHVTLRRAYAHPGTVVFAATAGSAQTLPDGGMFVGWGSQPRFSQFHPDGRLLLDGRMESKAQSYRAFTRAWTGHPTERPAVAARRAGDGAVVYASWNGATDVASWTVLAGRSEGSLSTAGSGRRSGFETQIGVRSTGPYFAAQANDASGRPLATSLPVVIG